MKHRLNILFLFLFVTASVQAQDLNIFRLEPFAIRSLTSTYFLSISDVYFPNEEMDSIAMPDTKTIDKSAARSIKLESKYRKRILSRSDIKETDKIFIYDYITGRLDSFSVNTLDLFAILNPFTDTSECPCPSYYYMIGFMIEERRPPKSVVNYNSSFAYIGNKSPFLQEKLKQITWQATEPEAFPTLFNRSSADSATDELGIDGELKTGEVFKFQNNDLQYYIRNIYYHERVVARQLTVTQLANGKIVCEKYYGEGEGTLLAGLSINPGSKNYWANQWTGKLFKDKPPVIFGFQHSTFGCEGITFLEPSAKEIFIKCDNRH